MKELSVKEKIIAVIKKEKKLEALSAFLRFVSVSFLCFFVFSVLETLFWFGTSARGLMFFAFAFCAGYSLIKFVFPSAKNLFEKITLKKILIKAEKTSAKLGFTKDEIANALELAERKPDGFSNELLEAAVEKALNEIPADYFTPDVKGTKRNIFRYSFLLLALLTSFTLIKPLSSGALRLAMFTKEFKPPQKFGFAVTPGDTLITKGDTLNVTATLYGEVPPRFSLFVKKGNESVFVNKRTFKTTRQKYFYKFEKVQEPFAYFFEAENVSSDTFNVKVVEPPFVRNVQVTVIPPRYTGRKPEKINGDGNIVALKGSVVKIKAEASKTLKSAYIEFPHKKIPLEIKGKNLFGKFKALKSTEYKFALFDSLGNKNRYPISYSVEVSEDEFPEIEILSPAKDIELGNENGIPLVIKISDDYGFSKLVLKYKRTFTKFQDSDTTLHGIRLPIEKKDEQTVLYDWNLLPLNIQVNDVISYYAEVYDNDAIGGYKKSVSKTYKIYLPPLEEFLAKAENESKKALQEFAKSLKEAEKLKQEMQKLSNELKKNKTKISWEEKQKLQKTVEKFNQLAKKAEKLKEQLSKQEAELQKRNLLSPETIKKYEELQKLLSQMNDETLKKALQNMNKSLDKMQMDDVRKALEKLKKNEEAFRKSIERTIELFKRLLAEQKADEIMKRIEEIKNEQEKISEETQNAGSEKKMDELTKRQSELGDKLKELEKEAQKFAEMTKEIENAPQQEAEKFAEQMKNQNNEKLANQAAQNMMMRNMQSAAQSQKQLMQNLQQMQQQMKNIQQQMLMQNQMKTMAEIMRLTNEIIALSEREEALRNKINNSKFSNEELKKLAEEQNEIKNNLDMLLKRMESLSKQTFAITPEMGNALGKARAKMNKTIGDLGNRSRMGSRNNSQSAMAALNESADLLQSMLNAMSNQQGGGQGGMMSLMQQLQKMSGMQMQLNAQTKQMRGKGKSMQTLAQMQRLAGQQAALQKSLEELNQEAKASGKSKSIASDLERIAEEMKEVVSDLQSGDLSDNLIKKQERILSRMLDAQRSINERDFEKRREAKSGKTIARKSPDEIRFENGETNRLEKELLEALKEGYKEDYRELIRKYYKQLEKK